jgi:hypothetical protein
MNNADNPYANMFIGQEGYLPSYLWGKVIHNYKVLPNAMHLKVLSSEMDPAKSRLIRQLFTKDRGADPPVTLPVRAL